MVPYNDPNLSHPALALAGQHPRHPQPNTPARLTASNTGFALISFARLLHFKKFPRSSSKNIALSMLVEFGPIRRDAPTTKPKNQKKKSPYMHMGVRERLRDKREKLLLPLCAAAK